MNIKFSGLLMGALVTVGMSASVEAQLSLSGDVKAPPSGKQYATGTTDIIDFEGLSAGTIVSSINGAGGTGPIVVNGYSTNFGGAVNAAIIFNSNSPTGGDSDLGTPNSDFGGPGIDAMLGDGTGGEAGSPFQNDAFHNNVLIIAENLNDGNGDGLVDDPDDADLPGSLLTLDFSALGGVTVHAMTLIDVEADEPFATVDFYDAALQPIGAPVMLPDTGDNGLSVSNLGDVAGVFIMAVSLNGSGAIDEITYSTVRECDAELGDLVWLDEDCDGIQDDGEPGIPGVTVELKDASGAVIATTTTDANGGYLFTDLCDGDYTVCVDETTLPPDYTPAPCNQGGDDTVDNDCSPAMTTLDPGESDRSLDFGYCEPPPSGGGEGCTPGYWKQSQHFDSWTAPYTPNTLFSDVFENAFPGRTLLQVVKGGGGGLRALGRHTVAALLNSASPGVDYGPTSQDVIDMFNAVYPGTKKDYTTLKDIFQDLNESGCPLN